MKKPVIFLLAVCLVLLCFSGCHDQPASGNTPVEATEDPNFYLSKNGIHFTLPEGFQDYSETPLSQNYTFLCSNGHIGLFGIEEPKEFDRSLNFDGFLKYWENSLGSKATQRDNLWTITCLDTTVNEPQTLLYVFYESLDGFWAVCAYCTEDVFESYQETMWTYASSATFD